MPFWKYRMYAFITETTFVWRKYKARNLFTNKESAPGISWLQSLEFVKILQHILNILQGGKFDSQDKHVFTFVNVNL